MRALEFERGVFRLHPLRMASQVQNNKVKLSDWFLELDDRN